MKHLFITFIILTSQSYAQIFDGMNDSILKSKKVITIREIGGDAKNILVTVKYDLNFRIVEKIENKYTQSKSTYEYDAKGNLINTREFNAKNKLELLTKYTYDDRNRVSSIIEFKKEKKNEKPWREQYFKYDSLGNRLEETFYYEGAFDSTSSFKILNFYFEGKLIKSVEKSYDNLVKWEIEKTPNEKGFREVRKRFYQDTLMEKFDNQFDFNGNVIHHKLYEPTDIAGELFFFFEKQFIYNNGFLIKESWKQYSEKGKIEDDRSETYTYKDSLLREVKGNDKLLMYEYEYGN